MARYSAMAARQLSAGLLWPAALCIQRAEAAVAVGLQRAHAEFVGQGEGLAVVGCGRLGLRRIALRSDVAEEAQGPCLVSPFLVVPAELERPLGQGQRLLQAAGQQQWPRSDRRPASDRPSWFAWRRSALPPAPAAAGPQ